MMSHPERAFDTPHSTPFKTYLDLCWCEVSHAHTNTSTHTHRHSHLSIKAGGAVAILIHPLVSPGSCYRFHFTVCLIHSQSTPATASTSNTSLNVYRPYSSTTTELSACIFTVAAALITFYYLYLCITAVK